MTQTISVALLVDGDNVPSVLAGQILRKTKDLGDLRLRLAFCNAQSLADWSSAPSFRTVHTGGGKNASDILLSIHAMEYAFRDGIDVFAIVSSDGDLSHIAHRLRELGHVVVGLGERKAPAVFRHACSRFVEITAPGAKIPDGNLEKIDRVLRKVLEQKDPNRQGVSVSQLNGFVRAEDNSIKISTHPDKTWPRYLSARPDLYSLVGEGTGRRVRIAAAQDEN